LKISVRGIYSTALVGLFLEKGFTIVKPTRSQRERFGLSESREEPDVIIGEQRDRHYVEAKGLPEVIEEIVRVMRREFFDLIIVRPNLAHARFGFPVEAKKKLDELRSKVAYTVPLHHYCRAGGEALSSMVSFAEELVERGLVSPEEMNQMFREQVEKIAPRLGTRIQVIHGKLGGRNIILGPGKTVWRREGAVKVERRIMSSGIYDGLGVEKSPGDYALTEVKRFEWWTKTSYYSISGTAKGIYYNICTPVALYPDSIHYFDLEVDVVVKAGGRPEIIEEELLEKAVEEERIGRELAERALREAERIASNPP